MTSGSERYDALVIGAGIGGLTTASLLAARGLSVLVLERRSVPGGCCSSLDVDGHRFDIASSLFYGFGPEGFNANRKVLDELGVDLEMIHHDPCFRMILDGKSMDVDEDLDAWLDTLCAEFPACATGLRAFYARVEELYADALAVGFLPVADANLFQLARVAFGTPSVVLKYLPILNETVWSVLGPLLPPEDHPEVRRLKALLDVDFAFGTCTPAEELPLLLAVPILMDRHVGGVRYPMGGASSVAYKLVEGLRKHKGEIRYNSSVHKIVTRSGRAVGVELEDGSLIQASQVVCNANIWDTFQNLLDTNKVSRSRAKSVRKLEPSFSVFITCVSVDHDLVPEGFHNHTVSIPNHATGLDDTSIVYVPTVDDPALAPTGKHAVTLINVTDYNRWVADGDAYGQPNAELDSQHTARALALAEEFIPGISTQGKVMGTLSPVDLERTLGRRFGVVGGPKQNVAQSLNRRQGNTTEIEGLFLVGDSTFPGEGVVAVTISGMTCADQICAKFGKKNTNIEDHKSKKTAIDVAKSALGGLFRRAG